MNKLSSIYGLSSRIKLEHVGENHLGIIKRIKSRIIQKDAQKIIEIAETIREKDPNFKVSLICNDNICSKSIALLKENKIEVSY